LSRCDSQFKGQGPKLTEIIEESCNKSESVVCREERQKSNRGRLAANERESKPTAEAQDAQGSAGNTGKIAVFFFPHFLRTSAQFLRWV